MDIVLKQNIPNGWRTEKVETLFEIGRGRVISKEEIQRNPGPYPVYSSQTSNNGEFGKMGTYDFDGEYLTWTTDGIYAGAVFYRTGKFNCTNVCGTLKKKVNMDIRFFSYALPLQAESHVVKTANPKLMNNVMARVLVLVPPIKEQQKIAEILGAVDEDIAKTREVIETTEKLKKGLMQQLFTRGIGHTKFKETKIGQIPDEWELVLLDSVAKRGSGHTPNKKVKEYYDGGIKWISLADSKLLDKGEINKTKIEISTKGLENSSAVLHSKGTVLLSRDAGVGKSAIMAEDMAVSQHFMTWTCGSKLNNWYLYYYLQFQKIVFERIAMGSTIKTIGLEFFKKYEIPLPPIFEQKEIAEIFSAVDEKISINKNLKNKLTILKKGLMQDLLSGRVRVNY